MDYELHELGFETRNTPACELQNLQVWMERTSPAHDLMAVCHPTSLSRGILLNEIEFLVSDCTHKLNQAVGLGDLGFGSNQSFTGLGKCSQGSCEGGSTLCRNAGDTPAALMEGLGQLGGKGNPKGTGRPQMGQAGRQHLPEGGPGTVSPTSLCLRQLLMAEELRPESWQLTGAPWAGARSCQFSDSSHQPGSSGPWGAHGEAAAALRTR